jgi:hypothetical protein
MHRELVSPTVPQRRRPRDVRVNASATPAELYPFTRSGHPSQCCYRQCSEPLYGNDKPMHKEYSKFVATVNRGSMHPPSLRGLCLCQQCHEDSELFRARFPYSMPVTELPVVDTRRPNDLNSFYQPNQRSPGCSSLSCGKTVTESRDAANSSTGMIAPSECDLHKNVYLCSASVVLNPTRASICFQPS